MTTYDAVIAAKQRRTINAGFEPTTINGALFDWQKLIVEWAIRKGRCALFEACGLGKTIQQLEWARQVCRHTGQSVLILTPLAVAQQTVDEGIRFGIVAKHIREPEDFWPGNINVLNYERVHKFSHLIPSLAGVVLDESSILKNFMGKTRIALTEMFCRTPYRLCCTATPAPNDFDELGTQAEFLGVCSLQEMLATWFVNDAGDTGTWRLKGHAAEDFWRWVASWAVCISKPSDLGFPDGDFILPPLNMIPVWVEVDASHERADCLFRMAETSAMGIHKEQRITCDARAAKAAEIVSDSDSWAVWCNTNYEADSLSEKIPGAVEIRGSDSAEAKERAIADFIHGKAKRIISKASIFGYGLNLQHCANLVYFPTYSFEDLYQTVRRFWRFGQKRAVNCHLVLPTTLDRVMDVISKKLAAHETMTELVRFSAESLKTTTRQMQTTNTTIEKATGENWELQHGDCVRASQQMTGETIDFSVFSPPFADLFVYSSDAQDMGNNGTMEEFFEQFGFLVKELFRLTKPGRLCAVHCLDLMAQKWKDGTIELKNFSGQIVDCFRDCGWFYHSRVTIWKDPVVEMQRTKALGLLHKQLLKDSAMSRVGNPEYICVFRKPGENAEPITHDRSEYPVEQWQKDASPVWMDIDQGRVLNGHIAREHRDERHICPLQLGVIERCLRLWSNPGDLVFSPFAGIGSEGYCAVKMGRQFVGVELKRSYFEAAITNLRKAEEEARDLFSLAITKTPTHETTLPHPHRQTFHVEHHL